MERPESKYNLGDKVTGKLTHFEGTVIGVCFNMDGHVSYKVLPRGLVNLRPVPVCEVHEFYLEKKLDK